jgi:hypothetical protein
MELATTLLVPTIFQVILNFWKLCITLEQRGEGLNKSFFQQVAELRVEKGKSAREHES